MKDFDPRLRWLPSNGERLSYLHIVREDARVEGGFVGPLPAGPGQTGSILRFISWDNTATELIKDYEHQEKVDDLLRLERFSIDKSIIRMHGSERSAQESNAYLGFRLIVDSLFESCLCSMMRVVISQWEARDENWISLTARDEERLPKRPFGIVSIFGTSAEQLLWCSSSTNILPSSSAILNWSFHRKFQRDGYLVHAHLLAPVVYDTKFAGAAFIDELPRTAAFGEKLAELLLSNEYVIRRGEGVWVFGATPQNAIFSLLKCQQISLEGLSNL